MNVDETEKIIKYAENQISYDTLFQLVEIYQQALNEIDDLMEYRGMTKPQYNAIASAMHKKISLLIIGKK